jgi:hypothetical protein
MAVRHQAKLRKGQCQPIYNSGVQKKKTLRWGSVSLGGPKSAGEAEGIEAICSEKSGHAYAVGLEVR